MLNLTFPNDMQEIQCQELEKEIGMLDKLAWADNGKVLSLSSRSGCLYTFLVKSFEEEKLDFYSYSFFASAMKPLSTAAFFAAASSTIAIISLITTSILGITLRDLCRLVFGMSPIV